MLGWLAGFAGLKLTTVFGRDILRRIGQTAGKEGLGYVENLMSRWGFGVGSFLPFLGPIRAFYYGVLRKGFSQAWKDVAVSFRAAAQKGSVLTRRFEETVQAGKRFMESYVGRLGSEVAEDSRTKMQELLTRQFEVFIKNLKTDPKKFAIDNLKAGWKTHLEKLNNPLLTGHLDAVAALDDAVISSAARAREVALQAQQAASLFNTKLLSNMAVVGIPTLSSSVMTVAVTRALYRKGRNRMRGYIM